MLRNVKGVCVVKISEWVVGDVVLYMSVSCAITERFYVIEDGVYSSPE